MKFKPDMFSDGGSARHAMRPNELWEVDVSILDVPGRPRVVIAVDAHSRLPTVAAIKSGAGGDIVTTLDDACRPFGYPQEIRTDGSFELASPALKELGRATRRRAHLPAAAPRLESDPRKSPGYARRQAGRR
jgi:hypothetical protein